MRISDWSSDVCSSDLWPLTLCAFTSAAVILRKLRSSLTFSSRTAVADTLDGGSIEMIASHWSTEERRVGKGCVSTYIYRWSPDPTKKYTLHTLSTPNITDSK